jgi:hypothetical protein
MSASDAAAYTYMWRRACLRLQPGMQRRGAPLRSRGRDPICELPRESYLRCGPHDITSQLDCTKEPQVGSTAKTLMCILGSLRRQSRCFALGRFIMGQHWYCQKYADTLGTGPPKTIQPGKPASELPKRKRWVARDLLGELPAPDLRCDTLAS